jgi:hypothetical protein
MIMRFSEMLRENHNTVHGKKQGRKKTFQNKTAEGMTTLQPHKLISANFGWQLCC